MKKYISILFLLFGAMGSVFAQGIEFNHGSWAEIKAQAKKENKLIFLDFYTVWCAPCKKMAMEVFPLPESGAFFNQHFINVKVDAEKGEGIMLANTYGPSGYPTLIFTDAEGKQLYRTTGAETAQGLIKHGKVALNPQADYERLKDKYGKNELDKTELFRYLLIIKAKGNASEVNEVFDRYFGLSNAADKQAFEMIKEYVSHSNSSAFKYLQAHRKEFYRQAGKEEVDTFIKKILVDELSAQFFYYDKREPLDRYLAAKSKLKAQVHLTEKEELQMDKSYYSQAKDEDHYMEVAELLVNKYSYNNDEELSMILGEANSIQKEQNLLKFKKWAEMAVALKDNALNYLGLAMIYDRLNDKTNALKYVDLSIASSKRDDDGKAGHIEQFKQQIIAVQGIDFQNSSLAEAKEMAKAKNKLIFIDFYTDWCGPCKMMNKDIFPQKEVGDFYNAHFIAIKIDAEKGEGPGIAKQYGINAYPTLTYINFKGEVVHKFVGSTDVKDFIEHGKMALLPQGDYEMLKVKFFKNELNNDELYRYFLLVKSKGDIPETDKVFDYYLGKVAVVNAATYDIIVKEVSNTDSKGFKYIEQHQEGFGTIVGKEKVKEYIKHLYLDEFKSKVWYKSYKTQAEYQNAKAVLKSKILLRPKEELSSDTDFYLRIEDEENYMLNANKLIETYYYNDDREIGNVLGGGSRLVKTKQNLLIKKSWAERALALNDNFINNAGLAMVYKSLKNKPMAIKYIDISIAQCKQEKNGYEERAEMIKKEIEEAFTKL